MSEDERREYNRLRQAEWRARNKLSQNVNDSQSQSNTISKVVQAEAEAHTEAKAVIDKTTMSRTRDDFGEAIQRIFRYWQDTMNHPKAKLDDKRRKIVMQALKNGYSEEDLQWAISGYRLSPHHMGENDNNTVYDSLDLILRDAKHIDQGLKFHSSQPKKYSKVTSKNIDALQNVELK
jgi:hypothetical protein